MPWLKGKIMGDDNDYREYLAKKEKMEADADDIYRRDCERFKRALSKYKEMRSQLREAFNKWDKDIIDAYFRFVLESDQFSINLFDPFCVNVHYLQYDANEHELLVEYRIPAKEEILPLEYFDYDEDNHVIKDHQLSPGLAADFRNDVARRVLLRAAASIFSSDELKMVDTIRIHGCLCDDSTDNRIVRVIKWIVPQAEVIGKSPEFIMNKQVFAVNFQEERSPELYKAESYQLRELLGRPRLSSPKQNSGKEQNASRSPVNKK